MLSRTLEPEVMDGEQEADEYDNINHQAVNEAFAEDVLKEAELGRDFLDLGTGTALIPIELCKRAPKIRVMALDASVPMLEAARFRLEFAGMIDRIRLVHGNVMELFFDDECFDVVVSNSLVHHLPDPVGFFAEAWRVLCTGGRLFIRDLVRPETAEEVERLVELYAAAETDFSKQLLRQSLHAALTTEEVESLLKSLPLSPQGLQQTSDRHWTLSIRKT
jgi:ubiquinone/menaquinone biosynthesis C-methylase UbiE